MACSVLRTALLLLLLGLLVQTAQHQRSDWNEVVREALRALDADERAPDEYPLEKAVKDDVNKAAKWQLERMFHDALKEAEDVERELEAEATSRREVPQSYVVHVDENGVKTFRKSNEQVEEQRDSKLLALSSPSEPAAQQALQDRDSETESQLKTRDKKLENPAVAIELAAKMLANDTVLTTASAEPSISELNSRLSTLAANSDMFFLMINGIMVYFMQAGFALLECGAIRSKNVVSVLLKTYVDTIFCGVAYWLFGYALAFGGNPNKFCGTRFWAGESMDSAAYMKWFFQYTFASKTVTIVAGAVAERCRIGAYMVYSILMSSLIYPIESHWAWDPAGWLHQGDGQVGYQDFAGSGVVHICGGAIAFVAALLIGPRLGRFKNMESELLITHHSVSMYALGGFILFVGFFSFNGASQQVISGAMDGFIASNAVHNTVIAGCFASVTGLFASRIVSHVRTKGRGKWSLFATVNAGLAGLVAICAGCDKVHGWGAAMIGVIAALGYFLLSWLMVRIQVDDAVDAIAVHFGGGFLGVVLQPFFKSDGILLTVGTSKATVAWNALGWNLAGALTITAWSMGIAFVLFGIMKYCGRFRVREEVERGGIDVNEIEEECYPSAVGSNSPIIPNVNVQDSFSSQPGYQELPDATETPDSDEVPDSTRP